MNVLLFCPLPQVPLKPHVGDEEIDVDQGHEKQVGGQHATVVAQPRKNKKLRLERRPHVGKKGKPKTDAAKNPRGMPRRAERYP